MTGPSRAAAADKPFGEDLACYYDFETTGTGKKEFTISGQTWDPDATPPALKINPEIQLTASGTKIGDPYSEKFGKAFSGGGTGGNIFNRKATFLCPSGDRWTITFWAMRYTPDNQPRLIVNGIPLSTYTSNALQADNGENQGFGFYVVDSDGVSNGKVGVRLSQNSSSTFSVKSITSQDNFNWTQGYWHSIVLVRGDAGLTLYVDGKEQGSAEMTEGATVEVPTEPNNSGLYTATGPTGQMTQNALDELAVWNRALAAEEVGMIAKGKRPISGLPAIYWNSWDGLWSGAGSWDLPFWKDGCHTIFTEGYGCTVAVDTNAIVKSLAFDDTYTLTNAGGSITLDGPVTVSEGKTATVLAPLMGAAVAKSGAGRLVLIPGHASSYSFFGPATLQGGGLPLAAGVEINTNASLTLTGLDIRTPLTGKPEAALSLEGTNTLGAGVSLSDFSGLSFGESSFTRAAGTNSLKRVSSVSSGGGALLAVSEGAALSYDIRFGLDLPAFAELGGEVTVRGCVMPIEQIRSGEAVPVARTAPGLEEEDVTRAFRGSVACTSGGGFPAFFRLGTNNLVMMGAVFNPRRLVYKKIPGEPDAVWDKAVGRWSDPQAFFNDFDDVSFLENELPGQAVSVEIPGKTLAGDVEVESGYAFRGGPVEAVTVVKRGAGASAFNCELRTGSLAVEKGELNAASFSAGTVAVSTGAAFRAKAILPKILALRLTITQIRSREETMPQGAIAELRLFRAAPGGGWTRFEWPAGTKLIAKGKDKDRACVYNGGCGTPDVSFSGDADDADNNENIGNESLSALIDGAYAGCGLSASPYPPPNSGIKNNKLWLRAGTPVTIKFPAPILMPDGYNFCLADHGPRHPTAWVVKVSQDGETWTEAHSYAGADFSDKPGYQNPDSYKWLTPDAKSGGSENKAAFPLTPAPEMIASISAAAGGAIVADGDWTAALTLEAGAAVRAVTNRTLTLRAPASTAVFNPGISLDLSAYASTAAGIRFILAGDAREWPGTEWFNVTGQAADQTFGLDNGENGGYYIDIAARPLAWRPLPEDAGQAKWLAGFDETPWETAGEQPVRTFFRDNDAVTFGAGGAPDGAGPAVVNVSGTVRPGSVTFPTADAAAYLFQPAPGAADARVALPGALIVNGTVTNRTPWTLAGNLTVGEGARLVMEAAFGSDAPDVFSRITEIRAGAALVLAAPGQQTLSGIVAGPGDIVKEGAGTAKLTAQNTATGALAVNGGTLALDAGDNATRHPFSAVSVAPGATLRLGRNALAATCPVGNAGTVETVSFNNFGDALTLDGGTVRTARKFNDNWKGACYCGIVTVTGGKESFLTMADPNNAGLQHQVAKGIFNVEAGARLTVDAVLANGPKDLDAAHSVTKTGPGTMAVTRPPVYDGPTVIEAGTYEMNAEQNRGGAYTVAAGAALAGTGYVGPDIVLNGTIAAGLQCRNITMADGASVDARAPGSALTVHGAATVAEGDTVNVDIAERQIRAGEKLIAWNAGSILPEGRFRLVGKGGYALRVSPTGVVAFPSGTALIFR